MEKHTQQDVLLTATVQRSSTLARARNQQTYILNPTPLRPNRGLSMTVPDQSMSLRTILDRFTRGLPIQGNVGEPEFNEEGEGIDLRTLDLTERQTLTDAYSNELEAISKKITASNTKKQNDALKAAIKAELDAEAKAEADLKNKSTDTQSVK